MNEVVATFVWIASIVGGVCLAAYLCLLPPRLFLHGERWLTEEEFRQVAPAKSWCRHTRSIAVISAFPTFVLLFLTVQLTCTNKVPLLVAFVPLYFLWIYVPVGLIEMIAGVSVLVPVGRARGMEARYIVGPGAVWAGAFRLGVTAVVLAGLLVAAYW